MVGACASPEGGYGALKGPSKRVNAQEKNVRKGKFDLSRSEFTNKIAAATLILLLVLPMLGIFKVMPVHATAYDLTPEYAKAGATIDILNFTIVGPTGGTTLTSVTVAYTGTNLTDLSYASVYVSTDGGASWALFGWAWAAIFTGTLPTATISGSYSIGEGVNATVKLTFKLSSTSRHGHTVDGKVTTYGLTVPPGDGTDAPPIDPAGETRIDTSAPTVAVTYPIGGEVLKGGDAININWTASDVEYGLAEKPINIDYSPDGGNTWILIESGLENTGSYEWTLPLIDSDNVLVRVTAFDLAGNSGSDTSDPFTIDSTNPTISNLTPAPGAYVNNATPTISAVLSNGLSGINPESIIIEVYGKNVTEYAEWNWIAEPYNGTISYTPSESLGEGNHTVYIYVEDEAGNSANATWSFTVDTTAPTISDLTPAPEAYVKTATPTISANLTDETSGINASTIVMKLDGQPVGYTYNSTTGVVSYTPSESLGEGNHTVYIYVEDEAGNSANATWSFTVAVAVSVTLTAPTDGAYITTNTSTVTANASSVAGVANVTFYYSLDGGVMWELIGTDIEGVDGVYEVTWDLASLSDQTGIQVKAVAFDNAGNTAEDISANITLDRVPPTAPTNLTATATPGAIVLNWTASTDETSGVAYYNIYRGTAPGVYGEVPIGNTTETSYTDIVGPVAGITYYYAVTAVDFAGLESAYSNEASAVTVPGAVANVTVTAYPTVVPANGIEYSNITATVKDAWGNSIPEVTVTFTTTLGTLNNDTVTGTTVTATTNELGVARVTLTSTSRGTATVTATANSISGTVDVEFYGAAGIEDVMDMLADIKSAINELELKFHESGLFRTFVNTWFITIQNAISTLRSDILDAISNTQSVIVSTIGSAKTEILTAIQGNSTAILNELRSETYGLAAIKTAIETISVEVDLTPVLSAIQGNSTAILNELRSETYGLAAIKNAVDTIEGKLSSFMADADLRFTEMRSEILAIEAKLDEALPKIGEALSGIGEALNGIQKALGEIKASIAPPIVIEGTKTCPNMGSVELFSVNKTMTNGAPFKVSFTIDATELDSGDGVYVEVYMKAKADSSLVMAQQVLIYGRAGADRREVYMESLVNAEQVVVKLTYYLGNTSDDPIHFQAVISSP